jgi:hypothetical protein
MLSYYAKLVPLHRFGPPGERCGSDDPAGLECRQERYVVGVRADVHVSPQRRVTSPGQRADRVLQALPRWSWRTVRWRHGTQGWLRKKFVAVRCWQVTSGGQRHGGWWLRARATRGQPAERTYHGSNLPAAATREELAAMPIAGRPWSRSMRQPKARWDGINTRGGGAF